MPIDKDAPDFVTALARGLSVIRSFGKDAVNLTLAEVAERTGLTRPTARRFLLTLESLFPMLLGFYLIQSLGQTRIVL